MYYYTNNVVFIIYSVSVFVLYPSFCLHESVTGNSKFISNPIPQAKCLFNFTSAYRATELACNNSHPETYQIISSFGQNTKLVSKFSKKLFPICTMVFINNPPHEMHPTKCLGCYPTKISHHLTLRLLYHSVFASQGPRLCDRSPSQRFVRLVLTPPPWPPHLSATLGRGRFRCGDIILTIINTLSS